MKKVFIYVIAIFTVYIIFTRVFVYPTKIDGMSMYPTISPNEIKFTNRWRIISKIKPVQKGEIVIIEKPCIEYVSEIEFSSNNLIARYNKEFNINLLRNMIIKRVIGIQGDHIQITEDGETYINESKIYEKYVEDNYTNVNRDGTKYMYIDIVVPENSVYVMGDNRINSIDSRSFGCIPIDKIYSILY